MNSTIINGGPIMVGPESNNIQLITNYFKIQKYEGAPRMDTTGRVTGPPTVYQHYVKITPSHPAAALLFKIRLTHIYGPQFGAFLFHGGRILYTTWQVAGSEGTTLHLTGANGRVVDAEIKFARKIEVGEHGFQRFYDTIIHQQFYEKNMAQVYGQFYYANQAKRYPATHMEIWPGYATSIECHIGGQLMLNVDYSQVVIGRKSLWDYYFTAGSEYTFDEYLHLLSHAIVMTRYNHKSYIIEGVDWVGTPTTTINFHGRNITIEEYYKRRYNIKIKNILGQPLLLAYEYQYRFKSGTAILPLTSSSLVYLVPELCYFVGYNHKMKNHEVLSQIMKRESKLSTKRRMGEILGFIHQVPEENFKKLDSWGFEFYNELVKCNGRVLNKIQITLGNNEKVICNKFNEWRKIFKSHQMYRPINLLEWGIIYPTTIPEDDIDNFIFQLQHSAKSLGFMMANPIEIVKARINDPSNFLFSLEQMYRRMTPLQLVLVVVPKWYKYLHAVVTYKLTVDEGILSQFYYAEDVQDKKVVKKSVRELATLMNVKIGGIPWIIKNPFETLMIVGVAINYGALGEDVKNTPYTCAIVSSLDSTLTRYFNSSFKYKDDKLVGIQIGEHMKLCLAAYQGENFGILPKRIIFYRLAIPEEPMTNIGNQVQQFREAVADHYGKKSYLPPNLSIILTMKKNNTRIFTSDCINPPAGTVIDQVITYDDRNDFYLISKGSEDDVSNVIYYNVLYYSRSLDMDLLQKLTNLFCHYSFGQFGTSCVPAPAQYAYNLVSNYGYTNMIGLPNYGGIPHTALSKSLHYI